MATLTQEEILIGLKAGRKLRCDRKDDPMLPWLLAHPNIENRLIQMDEQSSCLQFSWREEI